MKNKRSLYQCFNAKVNGSEIKCAAGHRLGIRKDGISTGNLERGEKLEITICQSCLSYDEMGGPVARVERGWK